MKIWPVFVGLILTSTLPAHSQATNQTSCMLTITIGTKDGESAYELNAHLVSQAILVERMVAECKLGQTEAIMIVDPQVNAQTILRILTSIRQAGFKKVHLNAFTVLTDSNSIPPNIVFLDTKQEQDVRQPVVRGDGKPAPQP